MKALVYHGPGKRAWEEAPKPVLKAETDAMVRITKTTICGTDLHIMKGDVPTVTSGRILGHEGIGVVAEVGKGVSNFHAGDRVLISCFTSCGKCDYCKKGLYSHCEHGGWVLGNTINGTQAEYVRIPSEKLTSVGRLAAGVAHEINNPLTGVLTYSSYLLKRANGNAEMKDDLEVIVREAKRCREIVKGLLDFARQSPPEKRPNHINDIVNHAARILQNQLALHHVKLEQNLHQHLPPVNVDGNQIQQVLVNLLMNADDAIGEKGGSITITTAPANSDMGKTNGLPPAKKYVQIQVSDTGCGIPRENLSKIFEPFFTTKGQRGNGLGLAMVWGIIEKHDGRITVESEVGKGATFSIVLPVDESSKQ